MSKLFVLFAALLLSLVATAGERPVAVPSIEDEATFHQYARVIEGDEVAKFLIDVHTGELRFFDVNVFPLHLDYVRRVLVGRPMSREEVHAYHENYHEEKPDFILGYVTHHLNADAWTYSFWESDRIQPDDIRRVRALLDERFYIHSLPWRPDSTHQEALAEGLELPILTNDVLYHQADVQPLRAGVAVGRLHIVPVGSPFDELRLESDGIVILQTSYADLPPVAGLITANKSTPLSHVNLRARAWGIPNVSVRDAAALHANLDGQVVRLEVRPDGYELRAATPEEEAQAALAGQAQVRVPPADLAVDGLSRLHRLRRRDAASYGAKAANLGEVAGRTALKVPPGVAIPFAAFVRHLEANQLQSLVSETLSDPTLATNSSARKTRLAALRDAIRTAPIDEGLLDQLERDLSRYGDVGFFVRSSTNAEDLDGFSGAGLYETVPNVRGREALADAVRVVWASVYSEAAYLDRERFGIPHESVYGGVLVQVGVDATAAGVLVTTNLYDPADDHTYTINAKRGLGIRVVDGDRIPEQVLYDVRYPGARVISRSDDPVMLRFSEGGGVVEVPVAAGTPVLTEETARRIAMAARSMVPLFGWSRPLDVEWLLVGSELQIVQVRPFVQ